MAKISIEGAGRFSYQYPRLVVIVTSHAKGKDNAMTAAWHSPISIKPPLYGIAISPRRSTYELILEGKEFGVNFLPFEKAELMASLGGSRGKEIDKFERFHIAREKALKTRVPLLEDAYAAYECKLIDHEVYGDHEWIVGEIVATHILEEAFTADGVLDVARFNPPLYLSGEFYLTTLKDTLKRLDRQVYRRHSGD
jgi:flavin reductase (DIM6/NTAB) family NADH-FMN oxidoreductase RutF